MPLSIKAHLGETQYLVVYHIQAVPSRYTSSEWAFVLTVSIDTITFDLKLRLLFVISCQGLKHDDEMAED